MSNIGKPSADQEPIIASALGTCCRTNVYFIIRLFSELSGYLRATYNHFTEDENEDRAELLSPMASIKMMRTVLSVRDNRKRNM